MSELLEDLEKAYDEIETDTGDGASPEAPRSDGGDHGDPDGSANAPSEPVAPDPAQGASTESAAPEAPGDHGKQRSAGVAAESQGIGQQGGSPGAPIGWSADAKEAWKDVPEPVKQAVAFREQQMNQAMANTAQARQVAGYMQNLQQQYGAMFAAEGAQNPAQAIDGLMKTVSILRMGSADQKAEKIASMIKHYGVSVEALDNVLTGEPAVDPQQQQIQQQIDQRMAPVEQMMAQQGQVSQQQHMAKQMEANSYVESFAQQAEFMPQVRADMADMVEIAQRRGMAVDLGDLYQRACAMNPDVQRVLRDRQQNEIASKQAASQSVTGKGQAAQGGGPLSMRDTIAQAWDSMS